jgi:hypothetical protein
MQYLPHSRNVRTEHHHNHWINNHHNRRRIFYYHGGAAQGSFQHLPHLSLFE